MAPPLKWRKVAVDAGMRDQMDGFVGLEEITDYHIARVGGVATIKVSCCSIITNALYSPHPGFHGGQEGQEAYACPHRYPS